MGISIIWMQIAFLLLTVGPMIGIVFLFLKDKIKFRTAFTLVTVFIVIFAFTPIKLDNSGNNERVISSFDKEVEEVVIEKKSRVEYSAPIETK